jgi:hypothetical protein
MPKSLELRRRRSSSDEREIDSPDGTHCTRKSLQKLRNEVRVRHVALREFREAVAAATKA